MTHDSQWKHEAGWRDMEFAEPQVGPHSNWESEAKAWRKAAQQEHAKVKKLRKRVQELEAALRDVIGMSDEIAKAPMTADRWADRIEDTARAALKQEGEQ